MDAERYAETIFGRPIRTPGTNGYIAYLPEPIPRDIEMPIRDQAAMADAEAALGRLAGGGRLLPNPNLLVTPYLRREAVASTRIEGTQASLSDVYDAEADGGPASPDVEEVLNYVAAFNFGLDRSQTLPFSKRMLRELHEQILAGVRGAERMPGEFRTSQNWVGEPGATIESAYFVPPPPDHVDELLDDFERFIHHPPDMPVLTQAALLHYQFETIHPFLDGNGRLGRLLVVFFLVLRDRLPAPLLYISPYFEQRRAEYYDALQGVRERGDFSTWATMFYEAIRSQAIDAVQRAERLTDLREQYRTSVAERTRGAATRLVDLAFERPVLTAAMVEAHLDVSRPSALAALRTLEDGGILTESPFRGRHGTHRWQAPTILDILTDD